MNGAQKESGVWVVRVTGPGDIPQELYVREADPFRDPNVPRCNWVRRGEGTRFATREEAEKWAAGRGYAREADPCDRCDGCYRCGGYEPSCAGDPDRERFCAD